MTTNQNRGEQVTAEIGRCPCGAIAGHDGDCQTPMVCVRENELKALQLRVTSLEGALRKYGRHSTPGHHCAFSKHSQWKCDCGLDDVLATLSPSGPQEA